MILSALDSILSSDGLEWWSSLLCVFISIIMGFIITLMYRFYKRNKGFSGDLPLSLILMPALTSSIVLISRIIGLTSETARTTLGFSLVGMLCLVRFRSVQKDATDLIFIMFSIITGFLNGLGYLLYGAIVFILALIVILIVSFTKISEPSIKEMSLKVVVPENLNYDNLFDDILKEYTEKWNLQSVKTTDFGTMFELNYILIIKDNSKEKEFIDKIRERNGNLNISLSIRRFNTQNQ